MAVNYGEKYPVGRGKINVYTEGNGEYTIVILSGAAITSPVLEYRPLYRRLSDTYKIAVVEKSGYGMSESTDTERTVENMVNESREALRLAGINPPYVLAAHSYSGFEAIYWANTYSDEVKAVLSIDMGLPDTAAEMSRAMSEEKRRAINEKTKKLYSKIQKRGFFARLVKKFSVDATGMISSDNLNDEEKKLYADLFYKNISNKEMFEENMHLVSNAEKAGATGMLKVPAYFYISDFKAPMKQGSWKEYAVKYAEEIGADYTLTDKGHNMYTKIPDEMAGNFKNFLKKYNM
ncbi:MAG: alpha/beta hydrolase [Ruminococcus sp.]|nr:alpha/beta hydrolase [Ruminococcus sp.]